MVNKIDELLTVVAGKLGKDPKQLRAEFESGKFNSALSNLSAGEQAQFTSALNNPALISKIMSTKQAQDLYKKLSEGK